MVRIRVCTCSSLAAWAWEASMLAWQAVLAPCKELPEAAFCPCSTTQQLSDLKAWHEVEACQLAGTQNLLTLNPKY